MNEMDREQKIAAGLLIDMTDLMQPLGVLWPIAVSEDVEIWVQRTLPKPIGVPDNLNRETMGALDAAVTACMFSVMVEGMERLGDEALKNPDTASFTWDHQATWRDGEIMKLRMLVDTSMSYPAFTIELAGESA